MTKRDGLPCKKCGANQWYKDGDCVACVKERNRRRYQSNPGADNEKSRKWYQANSEKVKERSRKWYQDNPQTASESRRKWYQRNSGDVKDRAKQWKRDNPSAVREGDRKYKQANPEVTTAIKHRYRTRKTKAGGSFTAAEWKSLLNHYGNKCLRCGRDDVKLTADHVIPVARGGSSNIDNIQPLCGSCNSSKGDKTIDYRPGSGLGRWIQRKLFG